MSKKCRGRLSLCAALVLCIVLGGCKSYQIDVRLLSEGNGGTKTANIMRAPEFFKGFANEKRSDAPKELTISFRGETHTGTYSYSERGSGSCVTEDEYKVNDGSLCIAFRVDSESGRLTSLFSSGRGQVLWNEEKDLPILTAEELDKRAAEFASELTSLDGYSVFSRRMLGTETRSDVYEYRYARMAQDIETTDYLIVLITSRGNLVYAASASLGWAKERAAELRSFPLERAIEEAKTASGLTSPIIQTQRFGITTDGQVFLMLFLSGRDSEMPVQLAVTAK